MRTFLILLLTALAARGQIITADLVLDLRGDTGVTLGADGVVTNWADRADTLNNDTVTNNAVNMGASLTCPLPWTDELGRKCILFRGGGSIYPGTNVLWLPGTLSAGTRACSVYVVSSGPMARDSGTIVCMGTNWGDYTWLGFGEQYLGTSYTHPLVMYGPLFNAATTYPALNPAVFAMIGAAAEKVLRWNNTEETFGPVGSTALTGGVIGGTASGATTKTPWGGFIYRVMIYSVGHDAAARAQMVAALATAHGLLTNYTKLAVCMGDSTVEGYGVSNHLTWPYRIAQKCPEVQVWNYGIGSRLISTNGGSGNIMWDNDTTKVDPIFNATYARNWLLLQAGINDLNAAITGQGTHGRLTNYCGQRLAAHAWEIAPNTLVSASTTAAFVTNYNAAIRSQSQLFWSKVADFGIGSPTADARLMTRTDPAYFYDTIHPNEGGHAVIAEHAAQTLNAHRRCAGFW